jgi:hypothetical protein
MSPGAVRAEIKKRWQETSSGQKTKMLRAMPMTMELKVIIQIMAIMPNIAAVKPPELRPPPLPLSLAAKLGP